MREKFAGIADTVARSARSNRRRRRGWWMRRNPARGFLRERGRRVCASNPGPQQGWKPRSKDGHRVTVRCKAVVVACGAIHTAALLLRSGLRNEHIGKHLHLHPVSNVCEYFTRK